MPVFLKRGDPGAAGRHVGILLLDYRGPFVPGDVGNASSYRYPVMYRTVPGATSRRAFTANPALAADVVREALWLQDRGAQFITSDCGFFFAFPDAVAAALRIPVGLSSFMQLALVASLLGPDRTIGISAANAQPLHPARLAEISAEPAERLVVRGLEGEPVFGASITRCGPAGHQRPERRSRACREGDGKGPSGGRRTADRMFHAPPYARALQHATGLPVFDFLTMIDHFRSLTARRPAG